MRTENKKSKWKQFYVTVSQIDCLLESVLFKSLVTAQPKSRFSYVSLPNSPEISVS
jgi:hypothetical protein